MAFGDFDMILTSLDAQNAFFYAQEYKIYRVVENFHLMTFGDLDNPFNRI